MPSIIALVRLCVYACAYVFIFIYAYITLFFLCLPSPLIILTLLYTEKRDHEEHEMKKFAHYSQLGRYFAPALARNTAGTDCQRPTLK